LADSPEKPEIIDDWDSLPLDPNADDWDDIPPPAAAGTGEKAVSETSERVPAQPGTPEKAPDDSFDAVTDELPDWSELPPPAPEAGKATQSSGDFDEGFGEDSDEFLDLSPLEAEDEAYEAPNEASGGNELSAQEAPPQISQPDDSWDASPAAAAAEEEPAPSQAARNQPLKADDSLDSMVAPTIPDDEITEVEVSPAEQASGSADEADSDFDIQGVESESGAEKSDQKTDQPASERKEAAPSDSPADDQNRDEFLKSLADTEDENVPKKVELDLDGIFDEAKREADNLSPEATRLPEEAPVQAGAAAEDVPLPPVDSTHQVVKVSRYKLGIFIGVIAVALTGLGFGVYKIFFNKPEVPVQAESLVIMDDLASTREKVPGVYPLERFYISLGQESEPDKVVAEMEIILHYQDDLAVDVIKNENIVIRDLIFRVTKSMPPTILNDLDERRQLQANLLSTLNNLDAFHNDPENPVLTYVQISLLKRR
jgi:flagellar basal body-associated protein FliL